MSGGILGMFSPQGQGSGLLGSFSKGISDNSDSLIGLGLGMMSGDMEMATKGYMAGQSVDNTRRHRQLLQDQELQKNTAAKALAQKYNLPPELATDADTVFGAVKSIEMQKRTPKELSFQERQFNQLSPEQQQAYRQREFLGGGTNDEVAKAGQREQIAARLGMKPGDPAYQSFVATGRMPREDQAPLSATDKKFIAEADEQVLASQNSIASLDRSLDLSKKAYDGPTAGLRGAFTSTWGNPEGQATSMLDTEVQTNALASMKSIFGGNPTEGERQVLMDIQGSSNKPQAVRDEIYRRARGLAEIRLNSYKDRANQLRGGTFYKPQGQPQGQINTPAPAPGATVIDGYTVRAR